MWSLAKQGNLFDSGFENPSSTDAGMQSGMSRACSQLLAHLVKGDPGKSRIMGNVFSWPPKKDTLRRNSRRRIPDSQFNPRKDHLNLTPRSLPY